MLASYYKHVHLFIVNVFNAFVKSFLMILKLMELLIVCDVDKDENSIGRSGIDTIKTACFVLMTAFSYKLLI